MYQVMNMVLPIIFHFLPFLRFTKKQNLEIWKKYFRSLQEVYLHVQFKMTLKSYQTKSTLLKKKKTQLTGLEEQVSVSPLNAVLL